MIRANAPITLAHVALQAEMLAFDIRAVKFMSDEDVAELHRMVARCLLFIRSGDD